MDKKSSLIGPMKLGEWMKPKNPAHRLVPAALCFLALFFIGLVDYWADYRLLFTVVYVLPIGFATVFVSRRYAMVLAILAVVFWTGGDILGRAPSPGVGIRIWNDSIVFSLFLIIIYLLDVLRRTLHGLEEIIEERTQALRIEMGERQYLEREALEISERERQTFGHELHDVVCQELTSIGIANHLLTRKLNARDSSEADAAREIGAMVDHALTSARSIARGFFTAGFDVMGLAEALRELARNTQARTGILCHVEWQENLVIQNEDVVMHLFRIAQEAVQNAVKHAAPSRIDISLQRNGEGAVELLVEDNGNGLQPSSNQPKGLGLRIMSYRANISGGVLKVVSKPRGGVRITCVIPAEKIHREYAIAS